MTYRLNFSGKATFKWKLARYSHAGATVEYGPERKFYPYFALSLEGWGIMTDQWESRRPKDQWRQPDARRPYKGASTSSQVVALNRLQNISGEQHGGRADAPVDFSVVGSSGQTRHADIVRDAAVPPVRNVTRADMLRLPRPVSDDSKRYATPPSDKEKYLYIEGSQKRWFILAQYLAFIGIVISFTDFTLCSYETLIFSLPLAVYVVEQTLSLYTSTRPRRINSASHRRLVESWVPRRHESVDVFMPTAGEGLDLLENSMFYLAQLEWPGDLKIFILDDSDRADVRRLAQKYRFYYMARPGSQYKKAGNLQYATERTEGELVVIFDADFVPRREFLLELAPYMDDPAVGIVQSPQFFDTTKQMNWVQRCAGSTQELFYRFIQPSRDALGAAVCVGTSALYRRAALQAVGGFPLIGQSEDIYTGLYMADAGYCIRYVPVVLSKGIAPDNLDNFIAQQYRWCEGSITMMRARRFHTTKYLTQKARLSFWSGFLYYITTALSSLIIPVPTIVMTWIFPQWVRSWYCVWLIGALISWLILYPVVMRTRWRVEVLRLQTVYGFAHLFNIVHIIQSRAVEWHPTGSKAPAPIAIKVKRFYTVYLGITLSLAAAGLALRIAEGELITFAGMLLFFLVNLYVAGPLVASGIASQLRARKRVPA